MDNIEAALIAPVRDGDVFDRFIHDDVLRDTANPDTDFDIEFDAMVASWVAEHWAAEQWTLENGGYDEAQDCLSALLEARAIKASAEAREQQCLARLEAIALAAPDPSGQADAGSKSRELAWRSMVAEIAVATRQSDRTVQSMMGRATSLVNDLPAVLDALACDRISFAHARVIVEHSVGIEGEALDEYQRVTLDRAESTTPGKLAGTAKIAADRLRADTFEERHARANEARCVSIRYLDNGMSELLHLLPTPFAAAIFDRLTRQAKAVAATGDPRTRDQLRSDLVTDLLLTGEPASGEGAPHTAAEGIRAEVSIVIPALTLLGLGDEPAALAGHAPIDLGTASWLAASAPELVRVLTHPITGIVVSADTYRPSSSLRRYLAARDGHCRFPSCNRDARWCDIDHTLAWEHGGRSTPDNLAHLCRGHHTLKHHGGWKVRQVTPGVLEWTSPLGKIVADGAIMEASPPWPRFESAANREPAPDAGEHSPPPF